MIRNFLLALVVCTLVSCWVQDKLSLPLSCESTAEEVLGAKPVLRYSADSSYLLAYKQIKNTKKLVLNTLGFMVFDLKNNQEIHRQLGLHNASVVWHSAYVVKLTQVSEVARQGASNQNIKLLDVRHLGGILPISTH